MIREIAYKMQERAHGGLPPAVERRLRALAAEVEANVALAIVLEAVIQHDDGVRHSSPFAQQPRAGLEQQGRRKCAGSVCHSLTHHRRPLSAPRSFTRRCRADDRLGRAADPAIGTDPSAIERMR
jgi:hypothetical protein